MDFRDSLQKIFEEMIWLSLNDYSYPLEAAKFSTLIFLKTLKLYLLAKVQLLELSSMHFLIHSKVA